MASSALIGLWATGLWQLIGSPAGVSALTISGYATTPDTLGTLNNLIGTCFSGVGYTGYGSWNYDVSPDMGQEELAILGEMYQVGYYNNLAQATMGVGGMGMGGLPVASIGEGDVKIAWQNAAAIGTVYTNEAKEHQNRMYYVTNVYLNNSTGGNLARSVDLFNLVYPAYSQAYWGLG